MIPMIDPIDRCHKNTGCHFFEFLPVQFPGVVNDAWIRIADIINIPINELKKKKESLMTTFRMHHKKKTQSIKSGMGEDEQYNRIWPYYKPLEAFLKDIYVCSSVINTEEKIIQDSSSTRDYETEAETDLNRTVIESDTSQDGNTKLLEASKEVANAFGTLNRALDNKTARHDDDCELYAKLLATKFRKFPEYEREEIMLEIDSMLIKRRRGSQNTITDSTNMNRSSSSQSFYRSNWSSSSPLPHYRPNSAQSIPPTYVTIPNQSPHNLPHSPQYVFNEPQTQHIRILSNDKIYSQSQLMQSSSAQGLQTSSPELPVELHLPELADRTYNQSQSLETHNIIYQAYEDA
ncbi:hypothetical protein evm_005687 [Chilo suppressalis]|nr:hypothetical protein evm_005687 [Chilo suppressalis]